jgi:hypothetical protein
MINNGLFMSLLVHAYGEPIVLLCWETFSKYITYINIFIKTYNSQMYLLKSLP